MNDLTLPQKIELLRRLRNVEAMAKATVELAREEWEVEHALDIAQLVACVADRVRIEAEVRADAIMECHRTGDKHPAPGVDIRIMSRLDYDEEEAFVWARQHEICLSLDKRAFERVARTGQVPFVELREEPVATIATDLDAALNRPVEDKAYAAALEAGQVGASEAAK